MARDGKTDPAPGFDLRIGALVIDGFTPAESRAIAAALEQELGRLLADGTTPFAGGRGGGAFTFDRLDGGTLTHAPGASATAVGRSAARAVVQRLRTASVGQGVAPGRRGEGL